ncbi:hypothetical protein [Gilvimarinus polysaccharolyticus]|uniref:hypothetical protein n=1 Tax=Gilvimarinus polysaccharolyticus TaxID=863921 RepID=UPI0006731D95|nr:hypothetical protein [Gilvimarinus polysaccharolyticus]
MAKEKGQSNTSRERDKARGEIERNRPLKDLFAPRVLGENETYDHILKLHCALGGKPATVEGEPYPYTCAWSYREADLLNFDLVLSRLREFERDRPDWLASEKLGDRARNDGRFQELSELLASIDRGLEHLNAAPAALSDLLVLVAQVGYLAGAIDFRYAEHRITAGIVASSNAAADMQKKKKKKENKNKKWLSGRVADQQVKKTTKGYKIEGTNKGFINDIEIEASDRGLTRRWLEENIGSVIKENVQNGINTISLE